MRIAVNARLIIPGKMEGIGWYSYETLRRITTNHPEHEFIFIFDRPFSRELRFDKNVKAIWSGPPARHVFLYIVWFECILPFILKKHKADLFLSPDGHLSLLSAVPSIAVIHDLNFHHNPEKLPWLIRKYYNWFFPRFAKKAKRIATVSNFSKNDIIKNYGISTQKIDVTGNGYHGLYRPLDEADKLNIRKKFTDGNKFFIFIGLIIPRKNLVNLMKAFEIFKSETGSLTKLVVVGQKKWWDTEHQATYENMKFRNDIIFTGRLSPEDLSSLLASADALTYTPVFEGFGIPILEAFASGTPVITSNVTSMPEVGGDAVLLVNPGRPDEIAGAMKKIEQDSGVREELIQKGLKRKNLYSWEITSEKLWGCIEKSLEEIKKPAPKEPVKQ